MKKRLLIGAGAVLLLVGAAALALPALIDIEKHRPAIEAALASATGRTVSLGPLRFRVLPRPALVASGITVGEDPKFGKAPFLEAGRLDVRVRLLPLLAGRVAVSSLTIDRPRLRLKRDRERGWSLASLMTGGGAAAGEQAGRAAGGKPAGESGAAPPAAPGAGGSSRVSMSIDRLTLSGGTITLEDEGIARGKPLTTEAHGIDLSVTDLSATSPIGVDLAFEIAGAGRARLRGSLGPPPAPAPEAGAPSAGWPIDARLRLEEFKGGPAAPYLAAFTGVRIHGGSLDLDVSVKGNAPQNLAVDGDATLRGLEVDPLSGTGGRRVRLDAKVGLTGAFTPDATRLSRCDLNVGGSAVSVTGALTGLRDEPRIDARVTTKKVALKDVAPVLRWIGPFLPEGLVLAGEITLDATARGVLADPRAMTIEGSATLSGLEYADPALKRPVTAIGGTLSLKGDRADITGFTASLGTSRVDGTCSITRFTRPILDVRLTSPSIDFDEVLSLLSTATPAESNASRSAAPRAVEVRARAGRGGRDVVPARRKSAAAPEGSSLIRDVTIRGDLAVEKARVMNLALTGARAAIAMEGGEARLSGISLSLYKGSLAGDVSAVIAESGPPFTLSARLQGVDFNGLATDFSPGLRGLIYGTLDAQIDVAGRGITTAELRRNLAGRGALALRDGKLTSFGLMKSVAKALESAGGRGIGEKETPFTSLTGTFEIAKGKARTEDLRLDSTDIDVKGKGDVALDLSLDLDVGARVSQPVTADMVAQTPNLRHLQDDKGRLALDFTMGGSLVEPSVGIAPEMLRRAAKSAAKEQIKEKKKEVLKRILGGD